MVTTNLKHHDQQKKQRSLSILFVLAIILIATTLRTPLTAVGPIISDLQESLGISYVLAGSLTTIPLLAFAVVSPFTPRIAEKFGMEYTLFYSILLLTLGIIVRSLGTTLFLLLGTVIIGVAISFGNVLLPGFFKLKYPYQVGILMGIFSVAMNLSAGFSLGISKPIANTDFSWTGALAHPIILTILTLLIWIPLLRGEKVAVVSSEDTEQTVNKSMWKSPLAWAIALSLGFQSLIFYCSTAWFPEILISQGFSASNAGLMTSIMTYAQIPLTFIIPIVSEKLRSQRPIVYVFSILYLVGFTGLYFEWTDLTIVWMILIGLAGGASFGLVMMFFTLRTKTGNEASQISGFAQSVGYLLAAVGPIFFGYLQEMTNSWDIPNLLFITFVIILFFTTFISAKDQYI